MVRIVVIGSGNVAQHLIKAFIKSELVDLIQVFARKKEILLDGLDESLLTDSYATLKDADLYIIAVSDDAITTVAQSLHLQNKLIAHTSGTVTRDELGTNNRKAVFYPLQTFSKSKAINFKNIPICIEAEKESDLKLIHQVAKSISDSVYEINSEQRKALHVAAVFVSNFTNHLYQIGSDICNENKVSFEILKPLILETADKILTLSPQEAQTGPAKRKDTTTINKHIQFLTHNNQKEIYKILTKSILDNGNQL